MLNPALANIFQTPPFELEARTLFAAMTVQPSAQRKVVYNVFIKTLKAANIWQITDAIYLLCAHSQQAALLNIKNPGTNDATLLLTPTFTVDRGLASNGVDNAVVLINPVSATFFTQNDGQFVVRSLTAALIAGSGCGWYDGTDGITIAHLSTGNIVGYRCNQATQTVVGSPTVASGATLVAARRQGAGGELCYQNGVLQTDTSGNGQASTAINNSPLYLGRSAAAGWHARTWGSAYLGQGLSALASNTALASADLAYHQSVGAL